MSNNGNGNGNGKGFKGGGLATGMTGMTAMAIYLLSQPYWVNDPDALKRIVFLIDFVFKLSVAVVTGGILWLIQILLSDWYEHRLKNRIFKNKSKQNGRDKMEGEDKERVA